MGGEGRMLKRIPSIKSPHRHPKSSASGQRQMENCVDKEVNRVSFSRPDEVPRNTSGGGTATLQPRRTPLSDEEIEAILVTRKDLVALKNWADASEPRTIGLEAGEGRAFFFSNLQSTDRQAEWC